MFKIRNLILLLENIAGIAAFDPDEQTTANTMINLESEMLLNWEIVEIEKEDKTIWQNFENKKKSLKKK